MKWAVTHNRDDISYSITIYPDQLTRKSLPSCNPYQQHSHRLNWLPNLNDWLILRFWILPASGCSQIMTADAQVLTQLWHSLTLAAGNVAHAVCMPSPWLFHGGIWSLFARWKTCDSTSVATTLMEYHHNMHIVFKLWA
eukprot:364109-Chlamydomonas_euryale.AAC.8